MSSPHEKECKSKTSRRLGTLVFLSSIVYLLVLAGVLWSLMHCTEKQWYFGALLYLPADGWLIPLVILAPVALLVRPWVCLLHVVAVAMVFVGYMEANGPGSKPAPTVEGLEDAARLTVVTANIGQRSLRKLETFIQAQQPDVVAFQEGGMLPKKLLQGINDYEFRRESEFSLISRLPITESGIVLDIDYKGRPVAAWFELEYTGRRIVIYSVHMPTPRSFLMELEPGNSGGGEYISSEGCEDFKNYWSIRFDLMRRLMAVLRAEKRPMLVVGDLNTPDAGGLYQMLAAEYQDSYAEAGSGGGATFPGNSRSVLFISGPWLRLDYLFASSDWVPMECFVETPTRAQHLAVLGRFALLEPDEDQGSGIAKAATR